jgi:hypothetical protein
MAQQDVAARERCAASRARDAGFEVRRKMRQLVSVKVAWAREFTGAMRTGIGIGRWFGARLFRKHDAALELEQSWKRAGKRGGGGKSV